MSPVRRCALLRVAAAASFAAAAAPPAAVAVAHAAAASFAAAETASSTAAVPAAPVDAHLRCSSDLDCSLNGVCGSTAACVCTPPWSGPACASLSYAVTPREAFNICNNTDPTHNTWGGPVVGPGDDGVYHAFVPLYVPGSLFKVVSIMHGIAGAVTGPWNWTALPTLNSSIGINPAFLTFPDPATGAPVHSLWVAGVVATSSSLYGPFTVIKNFSYPSVNPAPVFHNGAFYFTNQHTQAILTTAAIAPGSVWSVYSNITLHVPYHIEDPFMFIDGRGNWHIINHAYSLDQMSACGSSNVSSHFFSTDGVVWHWSDAPYSHTVTYDDGSTHTFATLERPNIHIDATGRLTHLVFAADLETGDAGCGPKTACDNCKFSAHDGTTVVALAA